jgi:hypothetical protein
MDNSYWNMEKKDGPTKVMERDNIIINNLRSQGIGKCHYSWIIFCNHMNYILQSISKSSAKQIFSFIEFLYRILNLPMSNFGLDW